MPRRRIASILSITLVLGLCMGGCAPAGDEEPTTSLLVAGGGNLSLGIGESKQLLVQVTKSTTTTVYAITWSSAAPGVASVSSAGVVTGVTNGATTLTVTATSPGSSAALHATVDVVVGAGPPADLGTTTVPDMSSGPGPNPDMAAPPVSVTCSVTVGFGSGTFSVTPSIAPSGAVVCIKGGTYGRTSFTDLKGVKVVPSGPVTFTDTLTLQHNDGVTFDGTVLSGIPYGFTFASFVAGTSPAGLPTGGVAFHSYGTNNQNVTVRGVQFQNVPTAFDSSYGDVIYDGTNTSTFYYYNLAVDTVKLTGQTQLMTGTAASPKLYKNLVQGFTATNVVVQGDGTAEPYQIRGNIFNLLVDHWTQTGPQLPEGDNGIFSFVGNGVIRNVFRSGGIGYIARIWNVSLKTPSDTYVYNVIDVNTLHYGTLDIRIDATLLASNAAIPLVGNNAHVYNVTSAHKLAVGPIAQYIAPLLIAGTMQDDLGHVYTMEMKNCLAFNNGSDIGASQGEQLFRNFSAPGGINLVMSNNYEPPTIYGPLPSGVLAGPFVAPGSALPAQATAYDATTLAPYVPVAGSPLIGTGVAIPGILATDMSGKARGTAWDVGAMQH